MTILVTRKNTTKKRHLFLTHLSKLLSRIYNTINTRQASKIYFTRKVQIIY